MAVRWNMSWRKAAVLSVVVVMAVSGSGGVPATGAATGAEGASPEATPKQKKPALAKPKLPRPESASPIRPAPSVTVPLPSPAAAPGERALPPERIEADVSARSIAVTANFKGSEVVVFGTVDNSRQLSPEAGTYDVVVAVEGGGASAVVRRKSNLGGLWLNTSAATFDRVPSYYAVASTRPLDEIAESDELAKYGIGLENLSLTAAEQTTRSINASELRDFKTALSRLKVREGLYTNDDYGVTFSGRSLFRSTLALPANVPVGQLVARVYLFREGVLLNRFTTRVGLERTGIERFIYEAAHKSSWLYGIFVVIIAVLSGLAASMMFGRVGN